MDYKRLFLKFGKGALSGGLASVVVVVGTGVTVRSLEEIKHFGLILLSSFVSGAFQAMVELYKQSQLQV